MEKIKVSKLDTYSNKFCTYDMCTISKPVGDMLPILRADDKYVLMSKDYVHQFAYLMNKIGLGKSNKILKSIINNRVMITYQISTHYTFVKVRCTDPDVGLAYYMGNKDGIRYFSRKEIKRHNRNRRDV